MFDRGHIFRSIDGNRTAKEEPGPSSRAGYCTDARRRLWRARAAAVIEPVAFALGKNHLPTLGRQFTGLSKF